MIQLAMIFGVGFITGAGLMFLATIAAVVIIKSDFAMPESSDPSLLVALGGLVAVVLFMVVATQTHAMDNVCLIRSASGCWPGGN